MKILYSPWRSNYAKSVEGKQPDTKAAACVFCQQLAENNDEQYFILRRFDRVYAVLNLYPYNAGHVMVLPLAHVPDLQQCLPEARLQMMELINASVIIMQDILGAQGVNVGINMGKAAGGGIPAHAHVHILPRWQGDTNFLPALADTKTISFDLKEIFYKLKPAFEKIKIS